MGLKWFIIRHKKTGTLFRVGAPSRKHQEDIMHKDYEIIKEIKQPTH